MRKRWYMFFGVLFLALACVVACDRKEKGLEGTGPSDQTTTVRQDEPAERVQYIGMVIGIKPERVDYYKKLHAEAWPGILKQISAANIRNYNIYLKQVDDEHWYLFSHFEYTGDDFEADMKRIAEDPETKRWWKETDPCQTPIPNRKDGEWWAKMERVFYHP